VEELQGLAVAPVKIVGHEQERTARREDRPGDGVEQPKSLLAPGGWLRAGEVGRCRDEFGEQAGQLGEVGTVEAAEARAKRLRA